MHYVRHIYWPILPLQTKNTTLNIYLNGRFLSQKITGVQRYAHEIVRAFNNLIREGLIDSSCTFCLLAPHDAQNDISFDCISIRKVGRFKGHIWEQFELPFYCRDGILLNLCNMAPLLLRKQVVVIHDTAVFSAPNGFSSAFLLWYRFALPLQCRVARLIITVSDFSRRELIEHCGADQNKIFIVPNGVDHIDAIVASDSAKFKFKIKHNQFVLSVGSIHPNKNFKMVIELAEKFRDCNFEFLVAGGFNNNGSPKCELTHSNVHFLGYVTDSELKWLYENAACFIFPSKYEGFGIPPVEAMRCGCPVLTSNAASLPEVCGDAAAYAPPDDVEAFAQRLSWILENQSVRNNMSVAGRCHSNQFNWSQSARLLYELIKRFGLGEK